jgi:salicylate hydroxylase
MALSSVTIIGAGIGGLTAALSLQKKGIPVRIYEQASKIAEVGAGLHLSPNAIHIICELDLRPALEPYDFRPASLKTLHYKTGVPSFELPLDEKFEKEFGTPFIDIHRADLHAALSNAVLANDPPQKTTDLNC